MTVMPKRQMTKLNEPLRNCKTIVYVSSLAGSEGESQEAEASISSDGWYRQLDDFVERNLNNLSGHMLMPSEERWKNNLILHSKTYRRPNEILDAVYNSVIEGRYSDQVTLARTRMEEKRNNQNLKQTNLISEQEFLSPEEIKRLNCIEARFEQETINEERHDPELKRIEFAESILLGRSKQSYGTLYWQLLKLLRYIRCCNISGSIICLVSLASICRRNSEVVKAMEDGDGVRLLLNLLETDLIAVQVASMKVLKKLFEAIYLCRIAVALGAVKILVHLLVDPADDVKVLAAQLLGVLSRLPETRDAISRTVGISRLVGLLCLKLDESGGGLFHDSRPLAVPKVRCRALTTSGQKVERICSNNSSKVIILAVATALWRVSRMRRNRKMMRRAGVIQVLARLIAVGDSDLLVPVMGILQECASEMSFRASIRSEGILVHLLPYLRNDSPEVKIACARTLFQLVQDDETLEELHRFNAPLIFYHLLQEYVPLAQNALEAGWLDWADIWSELDPHNIVLLKDQELGSPSRLNFAKIISTRLTEPSFETSGPTGRMQDVLASSGKPGLRELRLTKRTSRPRDPDPAVVPANTKPKNATKMSLSFHLLHILLGVVWKCAGKQQMRYTFVELGTTKLLLQLASFLPAYFTPYSRPVCSVSLRLSRQGVLEHITEHVLYTLSELAEHQRVRLEVLADVQIGPILVDLLRYESSALLISTMKAITCLSRCEKLLERFIEQKVFRHLYSHLLHPTMGVRSAALLAMHEFLAYTPKSESLVRPIAGSLSNLITCLVEAYDGMITAENQERQQEMEALLAAVCSVASMIGKHPIQRLILVELGLAGPLVSVITEAHTDKIREAVAKTITEFGMVPKIAAHLSNMQVLLALVDFLRTKDQEVLLHTARAIHVLSREAKFCGLLEHVGISELFVRMIGASSPAFQIAAAGTIGRICKVGQNSESLARQLTSAQCMRGTEMRASHET